MKKKFIVRSLCLILSLLFLAGCSPKSDLIHKAQNYDIYRTSEDTYYIRLHPGYYVGSRYLGNGRVEFNTISEMKAKLLKGDFTLNELASITFRSLSNTEAKIYNPYQLYVPTVPDGYYRSDAIHCRGFKYTFKYIARFEQKKTEYCEFNVLLQEDYDDLVNVYLKDFADVKDSSSITVLQEETDPQTGVQRLLVSSGEQTYQYVNEVYKAPGKELHIRYRYKVNSGLMSVRICGEENGGYFDVILRDFLQDVDIEWLSQFGLTPFEGNEPSPEAIG